MYHKSIQTVRNHLSGVLRTNLAMEKVLPQTLTLPANTTIIAVVDALIWIVVP
jgi:hypothetical protein